MLLNLSKVSGSRQLYDVYINANLGQRLRQEIEAVETILDVLVEEINRYNNYNGLFF